MALITYAEAIRQALFEEMRRDPSIILFGEDVGAYGGVFKVTDGLQAEFGAKRVFDTPTSEIAIAGAAIGAAMVGARPIAEFEFIDFMALAMDQIANQAAKLRYMTGGQVKLPLVFRTTAGAGGRFAAQHSQSLEAWFCHVPGLKVVMPSTAADAKGLLKSAIREDDPVVFIENKMLYATRGEVPADDACTPLGVADVKRSGRDVTVVAIGRSVTVCLEAAEELARDGIEIEVIDPRTLVPLDRRTLIESVARTSRLVMVQEAQPTASVGASIIAEVVSGAFGYLDAPVRFITPPFAPVPYAPHLELAYLPAATEVAACIRELVA